MADEVDVANNYNDLMLDVTIGNRVVYEGESALECDECLMPIPEDRRQAVPGCTLCFTCANIKEMKSRHRR